MLDKHNLDHAPFAAAAHKTNGEAYFISFDRPDFKTLRKRIVIPDHSSSWGPPLWKAIHIESQSVKDIPEWIESIASRLPCGECKDHFRLFLAAHPVVDPFVWAYDLHEAVNTRLGKKGMTLEEALGDAKPLAIELK